MQAGQRTETWIEWENSVYDTLCGLGEMTRSDAQAMIEAQEMQGRDVLASAWGDGVTAEQVARLLL
ncbi:hypothetical protein [uncultured Cedecea sp.]|uniref:hypothetical protein n=1 Tax=uncultured Cedecea sp. TaxID=988762 RepID=UPI00260CF298|nr:hypothetical protein [uncultured Cedecea sp.]